MYVGGVGVPRDPVEVVKLLRAAAERGQPFAQVLLGALYVRGDGIAQNYVEAYKWYSVAARNARAPRSELARDRAIRDREALALKMDATAIAEAETLARAWKAN